MSSPQKQPCLMRVPFGVVLALYTNSRHHSFHTLSKTSRLTGMSGYIRSSSCNGGANDGNLCLFDFDANLMHHDLKSRLSEVISNAQEHGVKYFGVPGTTLAESKDIMELIKSETYGSAILGTCGVHPYHAGEEPLNTLEQLEELRQLITLPQCLGVGECGLDYSEGFPSNEVQLKCFEEQIKLSVEFNKPLYLHVRNAHDDFMTLMTKYGFVNNENEGANSDNSSIGGPVAAVHCFTGNNDELTQYVSLGFYIGLTGYVLKLSEEELKVIVDKIPNNKLLIETDAPYMGFAGCQTNFPEFKDKKKVKKTRFPNLPSALPFVLERIASVKNMSEEECAEITTRNALRFFENKR